MCASQFMLILVNIEGYRTYRHITSVRLEMSDFDETRLACLRDDDSGW